MPGVEMIAFMHNGVKYAFHLYKESPRNTNRKLQIQRKFKEKPNFCSSERADVPDVAPFQSLNSLFPLPAPINAGSMFYSRNDPISMINSEIITSTDNQSDPSGNFEANNSVAAALTYPEQLRDEAFESDEQNSTEIISESIIQDYFFNPFNN